MKQTAVEWLENQIKNSWYYFKLMEEINSRSTIAQHNVFDQAKEMEKEQIIKAVDYCLESVKISDDKTMFTATTAEQYYHETFKQQKQ
jgi:hypothetical protein